MGDAEIASVGGGEIGCAVAYPLAKADGTRELGQEGDLALTKTDVGRGLVAGVCVAGIALIAERLIAPRAAARKRRLGIG